MSDFTVQGVGADKASDQKAVAQRFYFAAWRWHFYAGLYVVPFLMMLSITGLIMVYFNSIETRFGEKIHVTPGPTTTSVIAQANAALGALEGSTLTQYIAPPAADRAALFVVNKDDKAHVISVDPYTGKAISDVVKDDGWFAFASDIHGTLLIGDPGDRLIEIAASLGILLVVTGLYLWTPRNGKGLVRALIPDLAARGRALWKTLHVTLGFYLSIVLVFFLLSGLAWAGIWGGKYVQAWSTFPAEKWDAVPLSDKTHASMNHGPLHEVPWAIEQTPMPASGSDAGITGVPEGQPVNLASIVDLARSIGFTDQFRVNLPSGDDGVYTVSADSMDGDTTTPTGDRTVHIDQYTGKILAEVTFADYSLAGKSMAVGIALHQGDMGLWNTLLNVAFCLSVIFLCISGIVMWWKRRPSGVFRLVPPPMPAQLPFWKGAVVLMLALSFAFPLLGLTLLTVLAFDLLVIQRLPVLKNLVT